MSTQELKHAFKGWPREETVSVVDREDGRGFIYCIGDGDGGPVKIGFTIRKGPDARLKEIQTGYPYKLLLLNWGRGTVEQEKKIHDFLARHRKNGEWFERQPALALFSRIVLSCPYTYRNDFIDQLVDAAFLIECEAKDEDAEDEDLFVTVARSIIIDYAQRLRTRNTALPLPFLAWLDKQINREDCVGDLAKDAARDCDFPCVGNLEDYLQYTTSISSNPAITRTVIEAWMECDCEARNLILQP